MTAAELTLTTRKVVDNYFECVNKGKWDEYIELFSDDIVMDEQLLGRVEGKKQLAEGIEGLRNNPDFHNYPIHIVIEGKQAMAVWNIQSPKADGTMLNIKGANYYTIEEGKISYFANFHDTAPFK